MRRLLIALAVLLALAVIALTAFVLTFDADRYRPLVAGKMEEALGRAVRLSHISLGWRQGLALRLDGLAVYDTPAAVGEPAVQVESASAVVRLAPLLRRELQVGAIVLTHPRIAATRDAQGRINLLGLAAVGAPAAAAHQQPTRSPVTFSVDSFRIVDGVVRWTDAMAHPPVDIRLNRVNLTVTDIAAGEPMDVRLTGALADETPNLELRGRFVPPIAGRPGSLDQVRVSLTRVALEALTPAAQAGEPQLYGNVSLTLEGGIGSLTPEALLKSLSGAGSISLDQGGVRNLNLLRAVFERFAMLPGLVDLLMERLPAGYREALAQPDTPFKPVTMRVQAEQGVLRLPEFSAGTDRFALTGSGTVAFDGTVQMQTLLRIEPTFTALLAKTVSELQALANASGELELPVAIQGKIPHVRPAPDMPYVASRLIAHAATDLLGGLLGGERKGAVGAGPPAGGDAAPPTDQQQPAPEDLLGHWLQRALKKDAPQ